MTEPKHQLLGPGRHITVRGARATIVQRKGSERRPIIRLETPADRPGAEALRGESLLVAREDAPDLGADEWWKEDLEGCTVRAGGRSIGTVARLIALPSCEALEVTRGDRGSDLLVPLVSDAVRNVDVESRVIEIDPGFMGVQDG